MPTLIRTCRGCESSQQSGNASRLATSGVRAASFVPASFVPASFVPELTELTESLPAAPLPESDSVNSVNPGTTPPPLPARLFRPFS